MMSLFFLPSAFAQASPGWEEDGWCIDKDDFTQECDCSGNKSSSWNWRWYNHKPFSHSPVVFNWNTDPNRKTAVNNGFRSWNGLSNFTANQQTSFVYTTFGHPPLNRNVALVTTNTNMSVFPWLAGAGLSNASEIEGLSIPIGTRTGSRYFSNGNWVERCSLTRRHVYFNKSPSNTTWIPGTGLFTKFGSWKSRNTEGEISTASAELVGSDHNNAFHGGLGGTYPIYTSTVAAHELGHVVGLAHVDAEPTGYSVLMNPNPETLHQGDSGTNSAAFPVTDLRLGGMAFPRAGDVVGLRALHGGGQKWASLSKYDVRKNQGLDSEPPDDSTHSWWASHTPTHTACIEEFIPSSSTTAYDHVYLSAGPVSSSGSSNDFTIRFSLVCVDAPVPNTVEGPCVVGDEFIWKDVPKNNVPVNSADAVYQLRPDWFGVLKFPASVSPINFPNNSVALPPGIYRLKARVLGFSESSSPEATVYSNSLYLLEEC